MDPRRSGKAARLGFVLAVALAEGVFPGPAGALHEVDHRFIVEGHVCDEAGRPMSGAQVIVKDTRVSEGATGYTDEAGYYKTVLHLHNDNLGDRILVSVGKQKKQVTAQFDPKDSRSERKVRVDFGSGCEQLGSSSRVWLYYGLGVGVLTLAVVAGTAVWKKQRRAAKRGKGRRR